MATKNTGIKTTVKEFKKMEQNTYGIEKFQFILPISAILELSTPNA